MAAVPSIGRATSVEGAPAPEADLTRALYERHATQIFRYCLHQLGSREEAEDAVQSTFLNAFRGIKRGVVPEVESAWLFKIAHNVCLSRRRSSWRRDRVESPTDFDVVEEVTPAPSRRADELIGLQDVLEQMPDQQRRAILLREWQGLSYREIGDELELSQPAVETLIFRARRSLAEGLARPAAFETRKRKRLAAGALGNLVSAAQSFLFGGGAAVKVAAVVAAAGAGTVVATAPVRHHAPIGRATPPAARARPSHAAPVQRNRTSGSAAAPVPPVAFVDKGGPPRRAVRHHAALRRLRKPSARARVNRPVAPPAIVVQPPETPAVPAHTRSSAAPGRLKKEGARTQTKGRGRAPGRQKEGESTRARAVTTPAASPARRGNGGKAHAPGRQKKADVRALETTPPSPVQDRAANAAPPATPSPPDDGTGNGNGRGRAK